MPLFSNIAAQANKNGYDNLYLELSDLYDTKVPGKDATLKEYLKDGMYEAQLTDEGKVYTVPWIAPMDGLVYNKKVLDLFGITDIPRTTDEFESVLKQIKSGLSVSGEPVTTENGERSADCFRQQFRVLGFRMADVVGAVRGHGQRAQLFYGENGGRRRKQFARLERLKTGRKTRFHRGIGSIYQ